MKLLNLKLHFVKHLFRHYLTANFIDVLHSPFVFSLYQNCIQSQPPHSDFLKLECIRKSLLNDHSELFYEDHGASNKSRKTNVRTIASTHLKPARLAQILYRTTNHLGCINILELGTSLGLTTSYLALGSDQKAHIHTIEGSNQIREKALQTFQHAGCAEKIISYSGTFDEVLPDVLKKDIKWDMVFIDGNHSYEATMRYFNTLLPWLHNDSLIVFDDIYWSPGMTRAWQEIIAHPDVKVSVDLFFLGLVFFRKEQVKENFRLRIL